MRVYLWWWYEGDWYSALVDRATLQYLYELLTISGGIRDDIDDIHCVYGGEHVHPAEMMITMEKHT